MKILVTGGAGFIGSNLVDALVQKRHQVVIIDNLSSGTRKNVNPKATLQKADIRNHKKIAQIFANEKPQVVFHLAAQMDVRKSVADPIFDAETNILATLNLIKLSSEHKVKKFIFSSSGGAIYGDTEKRPTPENHPEWPLSPYGAGKLSIDKYLNLYYHNFGLKYASLRYGNVYGPRQNPHGEAGVIAIFLNKMLAKKTPVINGRGTQTRDYVFVSDVVSANLLALKNISKVGVYNIGTGKEISVNDIFQTINSKLGNQFKENHGPGKPGEQKTSCLSYAKIKKEFGWTPQINFSQGIEKTLEWFRENN